MTQEIVKKAESQVALRHPRDEIKEAVEWGKGLMNIVESTKDASGNPLMYVNLAGNKYLKVEAWELIGKFAGVSAITREIDPVKDGNKIVGYQARVELIDKVTGNNIVGGAIGYCGMDSAVQKGQYTLDGKTSAVMSMAQTRATSKAFRLNYAFVAQFGGYDALPYEEVTDEMKKPATMAEHAVSSGATVINTIPKEEKKVSVDIWEQPKEEPEGESNTDITIDDSVFDCPLHAGYSFEKRPNKNGNFFWSHQDSTGAWCSANKFNELIPKDEIATAWSEQLLKSEISTDRNLTADCEGQPISEWLKHMVITRANYEYEQENGE